jgi:hypothetical protein
MYLNPHIKSPLSNQQLKLEKERILKTLRENKRWIPGGHANSIGRNKLASITKSTHY